MNIDRFIKVVILFMILFNTGLKNNLLAQTSSIDKQLDTYLQSIRDKKYQPFPKEAILPVNHPRIIRWGISIMHDSIDEVRLAAFYAFRQVGMASRIADIRQQAVLQLISGINDTRSRIASTCIDYLTEFRKEDFNSSARDSLVHLLQARPVPFDAYIRLFGFAMGTDGVTHLLNLLNNAQLSSTDRWAIRLALARNGNEEQATYIFNKIAQLDPNDQVIYHLIPDLIYTRNKRIFDRMVEWLNDDRKLCSSSNPDNETAIVCGYRIMEMLATVVVNYPYQLDATGELLTSDYDKALSDIRQWFRANPDYQLNTQTY